MDLWVVGCGEEEGVQSLAVVVQLWFKIGGPRQGHQSRSQGL